MFDNEVSWMFIAGAVFFSVLVYSVSAEKTAEAEAKAKVAVEAIKAGLEQNLDGYWRKPK